MSEPNPTTPDDGALVFRPATREDLPRLVEMLADDPLGATRERLEDPLPEAYERAFAAIDADPALELVAVCRRDAVVGTLQLAFLPNLSHRGGWRCQIEGVRVAREARGHGVGAETMRWAIDRARDRGCRMVQLTSDASRVDARRFYERLGFRATHVGMKLPLPDAEPDGASPATPSS